MLIHHFLERSARACADRAAVWFNEGWKSYGELNESADRIAAFLAQNDVQPGDRVAILFENSFDYIIAHFGALKAGAIEVSLNTELTADALKKLLIDCEAKVLFAGKKFYRQWSSVLNELRDLRHVIVDCDPGNGFVPGPILQMHSMAEALHSQPLSAPVRRIDLDLASIVYTSGSTGKPKGVMLSHRNIVSNMESIAAYLTLRDSDRMMVILPFHYIYGRSLLYTHFLTQGSIVIDNRFAFPVTVLNTMRELQVTGFAGVPSTFSILLKKTDVKARQFFSLRFVTQAGGGMSPALQKEVADAFHPARLFIMYGTTEAAPRLTFVDPEMLSRKWGSIGKAIPNVEVRILDSDGKPLPANVEGEIGARGSNIMMGYWKDAGGTAEVIRDGYYHTGDLGYEDEDGYIFITGRSSDIIKAGGNRVSGKEIEDALTEMPGVLEAAVIGVPDEILGEAIKAFVVPCSSTLTEFCVNTHLQQRLPFFKRPKWVELRESLPKNQSGKILKSRLRELEVGVPPAPRAK